MPTQEVGTAKKLLSENTGLEFVLRYGTTSATLTYRKRLHGNQKKSKKLKIHWVPQGRHCSFSVFFFFSWELSSQKQNLLKHILRVIATLDVREMILSDAHVLFKQLGG